MLEDEWTRGLILTDLVLIVVGFVCLYEQRNLLGVKKQFCFVDEY